MRKFKNCLRSTACLAVVLVAIALASPVSLQGQGGPKTDNVNVVNTAENPVPVSVQNGNDQKVLITLVEDVSIPAGGHFDFGPVEVGDFTFISFLGRDLGSDINAIRARFFFGVEEVPHDLTGNRASAGSCWINSSIAANSIKGVTLCRTNSGGSLGLVQRIGGPFLTGRIENTAGSPKDALVTLKAYLTK